MNKGDNHFSLEQLKDFLEKYPVSLFKDGKTASINESNIYLNAFKQYIEDGTDILSEYNEIQNSLYCLNEIKSIGIDYFRHGGDLCLYNIIKQIEYLTNYRGYWEVSNKCIEEAERLLKEISTEFTVGNKKKEEEKRNAQKDYIDRYYMAERILSKSDLEAVVNCDIHKNISGKFDKDFMDVRDINYPIILFLYNQNKVVSIHKVEKKMDVSLINHKKTKDFDKYSYVHINENIITDVLVELYVRYNPIYMGQNCIDLNNSIYRTLNQIKRRHKDNIRVDLRAIRKVIDLYEIPVYNLRNGHTVVDKDLFEEAINLYLNGK